jgi:hypothetical protein
MQTSKAFFAKLLLLIILLSASTAATIAGQISYDDVARNPSVWQGKKVAFSGKVVQVDESGGSGTIVLLVNVDENRDWGGIGVRRSNAERKPLWVEYKRQYESERRILENDTVRFDGTFVGIKIYTTVLGAARSVPHIKAHTIGSSASSSSDPVQIIRGAPGSSRSGYRYY